MKSSQRGYGTTPLMVFFLIGMMMGMLIGCFGAAVLFEVKTHVGAAP